MREGELGTVRRSIPTSEDLERLNWYLRAILTANVRRRHRVPSTTPCVSASTDAKIHFKREDLQPVFSFKLRGAYNRIAAIPRVVRQRRFCSSAVHAQGVALAARELGCDAVIAMPVTTPAIKVDAVRRLGATVALEGETTTARRTPSNAPKTRAELVPPSTIRWWWLVGERWAWRCASAAELGGYLRAGGRRRSHRWHRRVRKSIRPDVKVIGVEPEERTRCCSRSTTVICRLSKVDGFRTAWRSGRWATCASTCASSLWMA